LCERPLALKPEKNKRNVDIDPLEKFLRMPMAAIYSDRIFYSINNLPIGSHSSPLQKPVTWIHAVWPISLRRQIRFISV